MKKLRKVEILEKAKILLHMRRTPAQIVFERIAYSDLNPDRIEVYQVCGFLSSTFFEVLLQTTLMIGTTGTQFRNHI